MCYGVALADVFLGNLANLSVRPRGDVFWVCLCLLRAGFQGNRFHEDMGGALGTLGIELDGTCLGGNASYEQSG